MKSANDSSIIDFLLSVQDLSNISNQRLQELIKEMDVDDRFMLQSQLIQLIFKLKPLLCSGQAMESSYATH